MVRILTVTAITFFIPSTILGMISPVVVKLALNNFETAGNVVGKDLCLFNPWLDHRHLCCRILPHLLDRNETYPPRYGGHPHTHCTGLGIDHEVDEACSMVYPFPSVLLLSTYDRAFRPPVDAYASYYKESDYYTIKVKKSLSVDKRLS